MPNNKVKSLNKVKKSDKAHPFSRRAAQMRRAINREAKIETLNTAKEVERTRRTDRLLFFKFSLDENIKAATLEQLFEVVDMFICRNDPEIQDLQSQLRKNRPRPAKLDKLEMVKAQELLEFKNGFELPDLRDSANLARLRSWEGDWNAISLIKMTSISSENRK